MKEDEEADKKCKPKTHYDVNNTENKNGDLAYSVSLCCTVRQHRTLH